VPKRSRAPRRIHSAEGQSEAQREATEFIAFAVALTFISLFSAQKSHVKPQNHLTH
jgi:hypothetical protein